MMGLTAGQFSPEFSSIPEARRDIMSGKITVFKSQRATRVSAGDMFGNPVGTVVTGKIGSAASSMGFKSPSDTNYAADMTILDERTELIVRVTSNDMLPIFTSCCPERINFVQKIRSELTRNLSTAKSSHMIPGVAVKSHFAERRALDPNLSTRRKTCSY
jgi:iron only hydrogenase large subunit-like protein